MQLGADLTIKSRHDFAATFFMRSHFHRHAMHGVRRNLSAVGGVLTAIRRTPDAFGIGFFDTGNHCKRHAATELENVMRHSYSSNGLKRSYCAHSVVAVLAALAILPAAGAQTPVAVTPSPTSASTPAAAKTFALVSAVGDQFQMVRQKEQVGSHLENFTRQSLTVPDQALNHAVLRGLDRAVAAEFPDSNRVFLAVRTDATIQAALPQDREALTMKRVLDLMEANPARKDWDQIIIVTPKWLMAERRGMGSKLAGIGVYVQPLGPLSEGFDDPVLTDSVEDTDRESTQSRRFVAPFFYVQVTTLDAKTLKVIKSESRFDFRKIVNKDSAALDVMAAFTPEQLAAHVERFVETSALRSVTNQSSSVEIGTVRSLPAPPPAEPKK